MAQKLTSRLNYNVKKYQQMVSGWLDINKAYFRKLKVNRSLTSSIPVSSDELTDFIHNQAQPVFVLSTGRCGTKFMTQILELNEKFSVHHSTGPVLSPFSNKAFHLGQDSCLQLAFDAARYEIIRNEYLLSKRFVETNHRITFFAYAIRQLYPHAKFIHLYRDAYEFCQSGLSRNWYSFTTANDEGRLVLKNGWDDLNQIERIASLWCETNIFIRTFLESVSKDRQQVISSDDLFHNLDKVRGMHLFLDDEGMIKDQDITSIMKTRINAQPEHRKKFLNEEDHSRIEKILSKYQLKADFTTI